MAQAQKADVLQRPYLVTSPIDLPDETKLKILYGPNDFTSVVQYRTVTVSSVRGYLCFIRDRGTPIYTAPIVKVTLVGRHSYDIKAGLFLVYPTKAAYEASAGITLWEGDLPPRPQETVIEISAEYSQAYAYEFSGVSVNAHFGVSGFNLE